MVAIMQYSRELLVDLVNQQTLFNQVDVTTDIIAVLLNKILSSHIPAQSQCLQILFDQIHICEITIKKPCMLIYN